MREKEWLSPEVESSVTKGECNGTLYVIFLGYAESITTVLSVLSFEKKDCLIELSQLANALNAISMDLRKDI